MAKPNNPNPPKIRPTPKPKGRQAGKGDLGIGKNMPPGYTMDNPPPGWPVVVIGDPPHMGQHSVSTVHKTIYGAGGKY